MTKGEITAALSPEALLGKSKTYISRALAAKGRNAAGEYQLWASLALELLGKFALAQFHPCLVADPQSYVSLFAAAGVNVGADLKTITAKTLFERLTHVSKRFDKKTQEHCQNMSLRRNAELHSGDAPFEAMIPTSWEGRYWYTVQIILEIHGKSLEEWLGADQAKAQEELLNEYAHAMAAAARVRVETAAEEFNSRSHKDQESAHSAADKITTLDARRSFFEMHPDTVWETNCPACESRSFLAGITYTEEPSEEASEENPWEETVSVLSVAEEFHCPSCGLHLGSRGEIEAVGVEVEHMDIEVREREYEPDYGND